MTIQGRLPPHAISQIRSQLTSCSFSVWGYVSERWHGSRRFVSCHVVALVFPCYYKKCDNLSCKTIVRYPSEGIESRPENQSVISVNRGVRFCFYVRAHRSTNYLPRCSAGFRQSDNNPVSCLAICLFSGPLHCPTPRCLNVTQKSSSLYWAHPICWYNNKAIKKFITF